MHDFALMKLVVSHFLLTVYVVFFVGNFLRKNLEHLLLGIFSAFSTWEFFC
jgi:hypothetical protein